MRKNLNKALAWTLAFALAFPTQAVAAMPASQGTETSDSTGQEAQSDGSGTAENSGQSGENDSSSGQEGSTDTGSFGTEDGSGGSSGEEEGSGTESGSGTENGSGDGSGEEEGSGTESGSGTENGSGDGFGEEEGSGTESGSGTEDGSETGSGEEEGAESGDTENGSGTDTGDADTGEAGSGDADTGDAGEDSGTGQGDNTTDASEEAPADGETESGSADDESAAEEIPEDTDVVLVEEPETPAETEETKAAEKKENESETYTVVYEVDPEDGATVKGDDEVKEGKDLTFKVTPEDGYKIESVSVNGEEVTDNKEKKSFLFFFGDTYYEYKVTDVEEDLSVEILMAEDILRASDGDTEVEIEADDKNALRDVSYVEISELGEDDSIEAAIKEQLSEKQIVDYKAVDITLYDKDGNVAEPDGDVSVRISGVETDEDYDEVFIYHLEEEETAQATSRMGAMPAVNAVSDEEDSVSYTAKEVKSGVEDAIEDEGMIRFTADTFSPYVVVFVKDGNEEVSFHLQDMDGNELETDAFDVDAVSVGGGSINIRSFVEGNDLLQIVPDGKDETYVFQYATVEDSVDAKTLENVAYEELAETEAIYFWYEAVSEQEITGVNVHFLNETGDEVGNDEVSISAGEITRDKMMEILEELGISDGGYVYKSAEIWDSGDGSKQTIRSLFKSGASIYAAKGDGTCMVLGDGQTIDITFQKGNVITVNVSGAGEDTGNQVMLDGNAVGDGTHATQFVTGTSAILTIPVAIGQGYDVKITSGNSPIYDSSEDTSGTQVRNYIIEVTESSFNGQGNLTIDVAFTKIPLTFDFEELTDHNKNGREEKFHGTQVYIGPDQENLELVDDGDRGWRSDYPTATSYDITGDGFVLMLVTDGSNEEGKLEYVMDSFGLNNQTVNVPGDNSTTVTEIKDQAGETIAVLTITSRRDEEKGSGDYWQDLINPPKGIYRTYIFTFTNVKGNITVTGGNFKAANYNEIVYSTKTEGVGQVTGNGRVWNIGEIERDKSVTFQASPENGYYISRVTRTGASAETVPFSEGNWYGTRTAKVEYRSDSMLNMIGMEASPIQYYFVYELEAGTWWQDAVRYTEADAFELAKSSESKELGYTPSGEYAEYLYDEDGNIFAGWKLKGTEGDDYYTNGSTILATNIFNSSAVEYADTAPDAYVVLEPVYVPDENAKTFPVTVMIYSPDHPSGDSVGITVNRGSVLTADTVKTYPEVSEKISDLEEKGYLLDPTTSTDSLTVDSADKVFTLYYADEPVTLNAQFVSGSVPGGTINVDGYSTEPSASLTILGAVGSEVTFDITTPAGYAIDTITVNSEEQTVPQRVDGSYAFVYTVDHSDLTAGTRQIDILVSLKADPDAWATITFKTDENGAFTDGESPVTVEVLKGSEFPDAPTPVESIPDGEGGQWLFDKWDQAFPASVTDNGTYTALYAYDSDDADDIPEDYEVEVTFNVVYGTFTDPAGETEIVKTFAKTDASGEWSANGSYTIAEGDIPGVRAEEGYQGGSWDKGLAVGTEVSENTTFTYTFEKDSNAWATITFKTDENGAFTDGESPVTVEVLKGSEFPDAPTPVESIPDGEGGQWLFDKWDQAFPASVTDNGTYTALYAYDSDDADDIPENYEVEVTFNVVYGTFTDPAGETEIVKTFAKTDASGEWSANGSYTIAEGDIPGVRAEEGYQGGSWDKGLAVGTEVSENTTFTYTFEKDSNAWATITFKTDENGAFTDGESQVIVEVLKGREFPDAPTPVASIPDEEGGQWLFDSWDQAFPTTVTDNGTYTAIYKFDSNKDEVPDEYQITVTFDLDDLSNARYNASFRDIEPNETTIILDDTAGTLTFWLTKGSDIYPAAPGVNIDYATEGYAFDGWYSGDAEYAGGQTVEENAVSQIYNAVYAEDNIGGTDEDGNDEGDGTPDKYQIKVRFKVLNGSFTDPMTAADPEAARLDGIRAIVVTLRDDSGEWSEEGSYLLSDEDILDIYPFDGFIAGAWDPELTDENRVIDANDVTDDGREVWFLHTCVPGEGEFVDITFNAGENGTFEDEQKTIVFKVKTNDAFPEIPTPVGNETEDGKWIFTGWVDEAGNPVETFPETAGSAASYTAVYGFDGNNDNVPDESQLQAMIRPYDTTIYTGGDSAAGGGFPETELEVVIEDENGTVTEERPIQAENIESITINGYTFEGDAADVHSLFKVIYWNDASGWVENDQEDGHYTASLVFTNEAQPAFPESSTNDTGRLEGVLTDADGNPIPVKGADIGIEADYSGASGVQTMAENDADTTSYVVNADTGDLIVRKVEDMDANGATTEAVYRDVLASPEGIDPSGERATAVIPDGAEFYINGNEIRANSDRSGIKLLTDHIYNEANKENLLVERAFREAYGETGINASNAAERGYGYVLRYYDLVDSENGNAWVESSKGVDVYIPYQAGTDINTAFEIRHFIGLHRETGITEAEVPEAIATCTLDDMGGSEAVKNTEQGIMFHTEGDQAFSPFIIMWKLNDNTGDNTPGDNTGGNGGGDSDSDGGSSSPSAGPGASGSTYTAGVDGHWVHMDPDNIMIPISEDVPEGATPVTAPQWHQWKFILNNGMMLYDQWAYVKNPYAIGDQPDEGWFSFAENGIMEYGWYLDERTGKWYWMHRTSDGMLGTMLTGWHFDDQDGKWYYMSPRSGEMLLGWQLIDNKWYYFNPYAPAVTWEFNEATGGWTYNGVDSRPYGSMYVNETTPDGYQVGADGAWIQ